MLFIGEIMAQEIPIGTENVGKGMYVSKLDCPWSDTPFLLQGFIVQDENEVETLRKYCKYLYIDPLQSNLSMEVLKRFEKKELLPPTELKEIKLPTHLNLKNHYEIVHSVEEEIKLFKTNHIKLANNVHETLEQIKNGEKISVASLDNAIEPLVDSIIRNPDAATLLNQIEKKDSYTYNHSLSCSITAVAFGRQLGLPKEDLKSLALGALLFDIGKVKLPNSLLMKAGTLTEEEFALVKSHVELGLEIIKQNIGLDDTTTLMIWTHHERYLGQGYPRGLKGNEIPLVGRIAGIIDSYDAITSQRPYAKAVPPHEAIKQLYQWRDVFFQKELIESFIQTVGMFPVGTLVELTTGEVGVIIAQNPKRKLKPKVMLILDSDKQPLGCFATRDLQLEEQDKQGKLIEILQGLEKGAYNINPKDFYL
jgi:HD-GYP domain-containing protein (c-di-GMP phosphodiesterase class II)